MEKLLLVVAICFVGGMVGAWFRIVRYLLLAGLVLLIGAAAFQLVAILGSDTLGSPRASGPSEGLGAGAAVLMLFVLPPLIVGLVIFMLGWGAGWMLREVTKPDPATAERLEGERIARRTAQRIEAMEGLRRISGRAEDQSPPGPG